jgi:DNA-binding MarR family transcriptional regulator
VTQGNLEELSGELVVYAGRLVRAVTRRAGHRVPAATLRMLSQVDELGPVTIGRLAEADRCSQPTMSAAVSNLSGRGWALKQPNPADARSCLVTLTDEGRSVLTAARRQNAVTVADRLRATTHADEQDLATAVRVIKALLDAPPEGSQ